MREVFDCGGLPPQLSRRYQLNLASAPRGFREAHRPCACEPTYKHPYPRGGRPGGGNQRQQVATTPPSDGPRPPPLPRCPQEQAETGANPPDQEGRRDGGPGHARRLPEPSWGGPRPPPRGGGRRFCGGKVECPCPIHSASHHTCPKPRRRRPALSRRPYNQGGSEKTKKKQAPKAPPTHSGLGHRRSPAWMGKGKAQERKKEKDPREAKETKKRGGDRWLAPRPPMLQEEAEGAMRSLSRKAACPEDGATPNPRLEEGSPWQKASFLWHRNKGTPNDDNHEAPHAALALGGGRHGTPRSTSSTQASSQRMALRLEPQTHKWAPALPSGQNQPDTESTYPAAAARLHPSQRIAKTAAIPYAGYRQTMASAEELQPS
eukprot:gene2008-1200_t